MKPALRLFLLVAILFFGQPAPSVSAAPLGVVSNQKLAIPSYFYPGVLWARLEAGTPTVGIALLNPNSGPGASQDANYVAEIASAHAKGILVLGYVHTSYSSQPAATAKAEVDQYYSWYNVDGIFFDEVSTDCANKPYYRGLRNYVKSKGGVAKVIINPGINIPECYIATADIIVNFESTYSAYVNWKPSGWEFKYPASRFWQLVYATPRSSLNNAVALSKNRNAGWLYVTPDVLNNPWDTLPPGAYWTAELAAISH